uniref:Sulfatase n=1 Tax=Solibacter usitatus (strain Ellin6076) TaxID=234267 RepID=Q01ZX5_SOLUE
MRVCLLLVLAAAALAQPAPVIVVSVDTLRADRLSAYGYRKQRTPNLDSFAERATLYENAACATPLTLPSHASLFTSTYPYENRIQENAEPVPAGAVTLAGVLKQHGYRTAAFIASVFLERRMGLDQGFDEYDSPFDFRVLSPMSGEMFYAGESRNPYAVRDRRDGSIVMASAIRWLAAHKGEPVFLFVHLYDMHLPYQHGTDYDAQLGYVDQTLGTFKQALVRGGWWDRSMVVLLSDHGESLGDHGEANHGYFIYQSTMAVPLMIHWPAGAPGTPAREPHPVGLIDVAPTILDALHIPAPPSFHGQSLMAAHKPPWVFGESVHAYDAFGWSPLRSLRIGDYKFIEAPRPELYNLAADPGELHNLAAADGARVQSMRGELAKVMSRLRPKGPAPATNLSARDRALLGSLGYIAPGPQTAASGSRPDPKDRMAEFRLYEDAQVLLYRRRLPEAIAALRKLVTQHPRNTLARRDLGGAYLEQKQYARAREELAQVLLAAPNDYVTLYQLGLACEHSGLLKQALGHLEAACGVAPDSVPCKAELDAVRKRVKPN